MLSALFQAKYIVDFLESNYQGRGMFSQRSELESLREEVLKLQGKGSGPGSEVESEEDSDD